MSVCLSVCLSSWGCVIDAIYLVPIDWRWVYDLHIAFNISTHSVVLNHCILQPSHFACKNNESVSPLTIPIIEPMEKI
jgi:hypothetical protein